jgi:hypothetical protein
VRRVATWHSFHCTPSHVLYIRCGKIADILLLAVKMQHALLGSRTVISFENTDSNRAFAAPG